MHCAAPHRLFRLGKQRALGAEKKKVKILTEGSVLAVPGDQSCMETKAGGCPVTLAPNTQARS